MKRRVPRIELIANKRPVRLTQPRAPLRVEHAGAWAVLPGSLAGGWLRCAVPFPKSSEEGRPVGIEALGADEVDLGSGAIEAA